MYTVGSFSQEFVRSKSQLCNNEQEQKHEFDRRMKHQKLNDKPKGRGIELKRTKKRERRPIGIEPESQREINLKEKDYCDLNLFWGLGSNP